MVILTGGAGFIGSVMLKKLNDEGIDDVLIVDSLGKGEKWKNLIGKKYLTIIDKHTFVDGLVNGDFENEDIECIIHLGACSSTTEKDADYLLDNNYRYSLRLATYCMNENIRCIYASSAATYGLGEAGYSDSLIFPLKPLNMYGFSKHMFDQWVSQNRLDSHFVGLKFFNVFGPNEYHKSAMASMVYKAYNQIHASGRIELFESSTPEYTHGSQVRDFIYVKDAVNIMWDIFQNPDVKGIYNIGTGVARTWNDLATSVFTSMGKPIDIRYVPMPLELHGQYQNYTQADMIKLKTILPHITCDTLENNVADYVQNYLQPSWKYL